MNPMLILEVVRFELQRSRTKGRIAIWVLLVLFPIVLLGTLKLGQGGGEPEMWGFFLFILVPQVACLLGLLLWATPVISTEIEGQTWIFLAMRRSGRSLVLLGKYLAAVIWTMSAALLSATICVILLGAEFRLWLVMCALVALSCVTYAALYVLLGMIFIRRTMVTAVAYTLAIEYGLSLVPALANKLTINYRLRGLLADWMGWDELRSRAEEIFGTEPAWTHLLVLFAMTLALLGAALFRLGHSEFPTQQEG